METEMTSSNPTLDELRAEAEEMVRGSVRTLLEAQDLDIIDRWCRNLESGLYFQGQAHLKNADRFCCLGVYCVTRPQGGYWDLNSSDGWIDVETNIPWGNSVPPHSSFERTISGICTRLNDAWEAPFVTIAQVVRAMKRWGWIVADGNKIVVVDKSSARHKLNTFMSDLIGYYE